MKTSAKIAAVAAATAVAGAAFYALPALAHERGNGFSLSNGTSQAQPQFHQDEQHATLSATITDIPSTVTTGHEASHGAYFTAYVLDDSATAVPSEEPTTGGRRVGLMPPAPDSTTSDTLTGSSLEGLVGFHADSDGLTKLALYPSDGSDPILVTVTTADDGTISASSSRPLSVAYSADIAAQAPVMGPGEGRGKGMGHRGGGMRGDHGMHHEDGDDAGRSGQMGFSQSNITPNA